jgi:hypothetical protein
MIQSQALPLGLKIMERCIELSNLGAAARRPAYDREKKNSENIENGYRSRVRTSTLDQGDNAR